MQGVTPLYRGGSYMHSPDAPNRPRVSDPVKQGLTFAVSVPAKRALMLDADNGGSGFVDLADAVASGEAFAVVVKPGLLAVDFDQDNAVEAAEALAAQLAEADARPVLVASGRPGHRHLFVWVGIESVDAWAAVAKQLGGDVRSGSRRIRPPLTPHREGLPVALVAMTEAEALEALTHVDPVASPIGEVECAEVEVQVVAAPSVLPGLPSVRGSLSEPMAALLVDGDETDRYESGSEVLYALAKAAVWAGWTWPQFKRTLDDPAAKGGASHRRHPQRTEEWIWAKAAVSVAATLAMRAGWSLPEFVAWTTGPTAPVPFAQPMSPERIAGIWDEVEPHFVEAHTVPAVGTVSVAGEWGVVVEQLIAAAPETRRATSRSNLVAEIVEQANRQGSLTGVCMSDRQLNEGSGVSEKTIRLVLAWLKDQGVLVRVRKGRGATERTAEGFEETLRASVYDLVIPGDSPTGGTPHPEGRPIRRHDALAALSPTARRLYRFLASRPGMTLAAISKALGVSEEALLRRYESARDGALAQLLDAGLVQLADGLYVAGEATTAALDSAVAVLDFAAAAAGRKIAAGSHRARCERHAAERAAYIEQREDCRAQRRAAAARAVAATYAARGWQPSTVDRIVSGWAHNQGFGPKPETRERPPHAQPRRRRRRASRHAHHQPSLPGVTAAPTTTDAGSVPMRV